MFSRNIKFHVDIAAVHKEGSGEGLVMHCVTFTLLSGNARFS
jgi:hypothetical protein